MKTLERAEELAGILHVKTDAVVFHKVNGLASVDVPPYFNSGCGFGAAKLDGIGQQIDKNLFQSCQVAVDGGIFGIFERYFNILRFGKCQSIFVQFPYQLVKRYGIHRKH